MNEAPVQTKRPDHKTADAAPFVRARSVPKHRARRRPYKLVADSLLPLTVALDVEAALRRH